MAILVFHKMKYEDSIPDVYFADKNLSLKAKGLMGLLINFPVGIECSIESIESFCGDGETSVKSALRELKQNGYLNVVKTYPGDSNTGRIEYIYRVYPDGTNKSSQ